MLKLGLYTCLKCKGQFIDGLYNVTTRRKLRCPHCGSTHALFEKEVYI